MMQIEIKRYTKDRIEDVIQFENDLRINEDWGWEIDEDYINKVTVSFEDDSFSDSVSLLAYVDDKVIGRIDSSMIRSHFDGSVKAYLDWICVLKEYRHNGIAQKLLNELKMILKEKGIDTLIALADSSRDAQKFYSRIEDSVMKDTGVWIDLK